MALAVQVQPIDDGRSAELTVRQSADEEEPRWRHGFELMGEMWDRALSGLREHLECSALPPPGRQTWEPRA